MGPQHFLSRRNPSVLAEGPLPPNGPFQTVGEGGAVRCTVTGLPTNQEAQSPRNPHDITAFSDKVSLRCQHQSQFLVKAHKTPHVGNFG